MWNVCPLNASYNIQGLQYTLCKTCCIAVYIFNSTSTWWSTDYRFAWWRQLHIHLSPHCGGQCHLYFRQSCHLSDEVKYYRPRCFIYLFHIWSSYWPYSEPCWLMPDCFAVVYHFECCFEFWLQPGCGLPCLRTIPVSNEGWVNVGPTSGQQYWRWASVEPTYLAVWDISSDAMLNSFFKNGHSYINN